MAIRPMFFAVLRDCPDLKVLSDTQVQHLADNAEGLIANGSDLFFAEGDLADKVYFIASGQVAFLNTDGKAEAGFMFGEAGLVREDVPLRRTGVKAMIATIVLAVPVEAFTPDILRLMYPQLLARQVHYLTTLPEPQGSDFYTMLRCSPDLGDLSDRQILHLARQAEMVRFDQGDTILQQGEPAEEVYIIVEGEVMYGAQNQPTSGAGSMFGEAGLLPDVDDPRRRVFAVAHTNVTVLRLSNRAFTDEIRAAMADNLEMLSGFYEFPGEGSSTP